MNGYTFTESKYGIITFASPLGGDDLLKAIVISAPDTKGY